MHPKRSVSIEDNEEGEEGEVLPYGYGREIPGDDFTEIAILRCFDELTGGNLQPLEGEIEQAVERVRNRILPLLSSFKPFGFGLPKPEYMTSLDAVQDCVELLVGYKVSYEEDLLRQVRRIFEEEARRIGLELDT